MSKIASKIPFKARKPKEDRISRKAAEATLKATGKVLGGTAKLPFKILKELFDVFE